MYDYVFDKVKTNWKPWMETVTVGDVPESSLFNEIIITTIDTVSALGFPYLLPLCALSHASTNQNLADHIHHSPAYIPQQDFCIIGFDEHSRLVSDGGVYSSLMPVLCQMFFHVHGSVCEHVWMMPVGS